MKPIIISHRGNTHGPDKYQENNPEVIQSLLDRQIPCEVDVWSYKNKFYLGHDTGIYLVKESWLQNHYLFCHAKNTEALYKMMMNYKIHCFWHDKDECVLTNQYMIWQAHYKNLTDRTIVVDKSERPNYNAKCYGICCDYMSI